MFDGIPFVPFDYFSPLRMMSHIAFDGHQPMAIYMRGAGCTSHDIEQLLQENGIQVGRGYRYGGYIVITVDDRDQARAILNEYGIGVE